MKNFSLILVLFLAFFASGCGVIQIEQVFGKPATYNGDDRALLVGINTYPYAPLNGCVNDVNDMKSYIMDRHGFKQNQIKMLINEEATTSNILKSLDWLTENAKPGDRRLFHYSGHGAEYAGKIDTENQPNGLNQIVCPYDFDWTREKMIMDAQFKKIFGKMPKGVLFNWVSDSCYSGDLIKNLKIKSRKYPSIPSNILIQIEIAHWNDIKIRSFTDGVLDVGFISGCKYNQTSADARIGGRYVGALTYYFIETAKQMPDNSISEVVAKTAEKLKKNGYEQTPQAEGSRTCEPFLKGRVYSKK